MKHFLSIAILALTLTGSSPQDVTEWRTLYISHYTDSYTADSYPVLQLAHAKEDNERAFRMCAVVQGDGVVLLAYGSEGEGVEFHQPTPGNMCFTTKVGYGGGGEYLNQLDVYLLYYAGKQPTLYRPEIKVGSY